MHTFYAYLQHFFHSKNQHGIHSPFVYNFYLKTLRRQVDKKSWKKYLRFRAHVFSSNECLENENFGAGSKKLKRPSSSIQKIARVAGSSKKKAKLLMRLSNFETPKNILEFGTSLGLGSAALALGSESSRIVTLEGSCSRSQAAQKFFKNSNIVNITAICSDFDNYLNTFEGNEGFDIIFIDGNHTYEATKKYFNWALKHLNTSGMIIFDDIYWSKDMTKAWREICASSAINLSMDLFLVGIVMKREEQSKEHFRLKY